LGITIFAQNAEKQKNARSVRQAIQMGGIEPISNHSLPKKSGENKSQLCYISENLSLNSRNRLGMLLLPDYIASYLASPYSRELRKLKKC
jgi:hypothetical protein